MLAINEKDSMILSMKIYEKYIYEILGQLRFFGKDRR